jgi:Tol biopolymer transport system component
MKKLNFILIITLFGVFGCETQKNSLTETILYTTLRPNNLDIYLFEKDNSAPKRITNYKGLDYNATFSPDGEWIVYTSDREGNSDLYAMRNGDTDVKVIRLTAHKAMDDQAAFSPDGKTIVFMSSRGGYSDLWQMPFNPASPALTEEQSAFNLTKTDFYGEFNPAFSPNGKQIAYARENPATHNMNIYLQAVDDPNDAGKPLEPDRLNLFSADVHPRFSPDGKWVVFVSSRALTKDEWTSSGFHPQPDGEIFVKRIDSDELAVQLTDDKWEDGITPSWTFIETGRK